MKILYKLFNYKTITINNNMENFKPIKPLLKWVGGKTQIIKDINLLIPTEITNYYEPFLGGGSVLLNILSLKKNNYINITGHIKVNDLNTGLINFYNSIKSNPEDLIEEINKILVEYKSCPIVEKKNEIINRKVETKEEAMKCTENYYYWKRKRFNSLDKTSLEYSALFWFINKTCFRGLYREGPNGYNVPFGHYKTFPSITKKEIDTISDLIQNVEFYNMDYKTFIELVNKDNNQNNFIYYDPPYVPENEKSFVGYNKEGFTLTNHKELFTLIKSLPSTVKFLMSNAKVNLVIDEFKEEEKSDKQNVKIKKYVIKDIKCKRHINAKKPDSTTMEVLITNY
jgi:DNA adenine methylase